LSDATTDNYELMVATFSTTDGADAMMSALEDMAKSGAVHIQEAAVLRMAEDGSTSVSQANLPSVGRAAGWGAVVGAVVGVIFPPSLIGATLLGAGIGAAGGGIARATSKDEELKALAEDLEPGTSVFIAIVEDQWLTELQNAMAGYQKIAAAALDADAVASIRAQIGTDGATVQAFAADSDTVVAAAGVVVAGDDPALDDGSDDSGDDDSSDG